jgi:hypothetical protein
LVAGNHDHWKDSSWSPNPLDDRPPAFNKAIYDQSYFKKPVEVQCWSSGSGKLRLELFGVDSASGLEPKTHNKRARGAISPKELQLLEDELTKRDREPVPAGAVWLRAIVCHHSLYFGSKGQTQKEYHQGANSLDDYSRQRLLEIARKNSVCAILTGHIHIFGDPYAHEKPPELRSPDSKPVWELNCTTTLQDPVDGRPNAFWVHRVRLFGGKPEWFAIPYASSSGLRFEEGKWSPLRPLTFRVQET